MNLLELLIKNKKQILEEACGNLHSEHLMSYDTSTSEENQFRLEKLLDLAIESVKTKKLIHITDYSKQVAKERYESGFDLHEVHTAFNSLEEVIWKNILKKLNPENTGEALGMISTILGAGKEALALTYVSLAGKRKANTLNLSKLFERG
jgi:hypothetical protein